MSATLQPALSYRFRIRTEFTDLPCDALSLNVDSCNIDLIGKILSIKVRHSMDGEVSRFVKNMQETSPNFILDVMNSECAPAHSIAFVDTTFKKLNTSFDYSNSAPAHWEMEVKFEKFNISKGVEEKESE